MSEPVRLMGPCAAVSAFLLLALQACGGSSSYTSDAQSAVRAMAAAIRTYNSSPAGDVGATGRACRTAEDQLHSISTLVSTSPPSAYSRVASALRNAYTSARAGLSDCAIGASSGDYARMARADTEIAAANLWIRRARSLDR